MAYDIQQLLKMSQAELDDLFTASPAGDIPNGRGRGHGDHRTGHDLQPEPRLVHQQLRLAGQGLRR